MSFQDHIDKRAKEISARIRKHGMNPGHKRFKEWKEKQEVKNVRRICK